MASPKTKKTRLIRDIYVNREYSWLLFNRRVLDQCRAEENPLLERLRFLSIFSSNLDEFFMVRVGSLVHEAVSSPEAKENKTGLTAKKQLEALLPLTERLYRRRSAVFSTLCQELSEEKIRLLRARELSREERRLGEVVFSEKVLPLLSLLVLDAKHPLMQFENKKLYGLYELEKNGRRMIGVMAPNDSLNRLYPLGEGETLRLLPLEELLRAFGHKAFLGYQVRARLFLRVTRNADFDITLGDNDRERDFPALMRQKVESRSRLDIVRLEVEEKESRLTDFALKLLHLDPAFCFEEKRFLDYRFLSALGDYLPKEQKARLSYPPFQGRVKRYTGKGRTGSGWINAILKKDLFLSYPYDSMAPLTELLAECVSDSRVIAIGITLYRLAHHSGIAELLCRASENGKQVTVVIELAARFDEENNLFFASRLKEAGCTLIYGMENYKVHSKILSVLLKEGEKLSYITHLGTGNYNESTGKQYTDLNILTAHREIGEDAAAFFRNLAIGHTDYRYRRLLVAPDTLKPGLVALIDREIAKGEAGYLLFKMNSLTDKPILDKLVEASRAGVAIDLIVRGICCLLPGVPGRTEHIRVVSIVGRFLEHSRVYSFGRGKARVTYISSADLMTRNTDKRVEIAAPVLDKSIENEIIAQLERMLSDTVKARLLSSDGKYRRAESDGVPFDSQAALLAAAGALAPPSVPWENTSSGKNQKE